jgi:hypothetical protein
VREHSIGCTGKSKPSLLHATCQASSLPHRVHTTCKRHAHHMKHSPLAWSIEGTSQQAEQDQAGICPPQPTCPAEAPSRNCLELLKQQYKQPSDFIHHLHTIRTAYCLAAIKPWPSCTHRKMLAVSLRELQRNHCQLCPWPANRSPGSPPQALVACAASRFCFLRRFFLLADILSSPSSILSTCEGAAGGGAAPCCL